MVRSFTLFILILALLPRAHAASDVAVPAQTEVSVSIPQIGEYQCPASVQLTSAERDAMIRFNSRLSGLWRDYGKDTFEPRLRALLRGYDPEAKLIEVSALFLEKILNIIDIYRLRHAIERTIGQDDKLWDEFERTMWSVMMHDSVYYRKHGVFDKKVQKLLLHIRNADRRVESPVIQYDRVTRKKYIEDAVLRTANMYISLQRVDSINRQAIDERAEDASRQMAVLAIGLVAGGALVASTIYAGPIVAAAGLSAGSLSANAATSALLVRLGQVAAGAGLGIVGAPTGLLISDSAGTLLRAGRQSQNLRTSYSCEIGKELKEMKNRGLRPYINAALAGGTIGLGGGALTLAGTAVSRALLAVTVLGVGIAEAYSIGQLSQNTLFAIAEYQLAIEAINKGPEHRAEALKHLHKSREYAQAAGEVAVTGVIVTVLSVSIATELRGALIEGAGAIRAIFANSSDTLPVSLQIAKEAITSATN